MKAVDVDEGDKDEALTFRDGPAGVSEVATVDEGVASVDEVGRVVGLDVSAATNEVAWAVE